jgi:DNA repair protein RecO (recombination protein O)
MLKNAEFELGLVLHRRPYRETSMIIDFFTANQGRQSAVARGMRQSKSDRKSLLQVFQPLHLRFSGKSDLKTLSHVEPAAPAYSLKGDALYCGFYVNELITRILPQGVSCDAFFEHYLLCLDALQNNVDNEVTLRRYEFALLDELGVLPDLSSSSDGRDINVACFYQFQAGIGVVPFEPKQQNKSNNIDTFLGQTFLDVCEGNWHADSKRLAKQLCRKALYPFLGSKPLHSRALFKTT